MFWITHFQNLNHSLMSVYPKLRYTCLRTTAPPPPEKMARMNSASYDKLRSLSRGKLSPQQFLRLKELAANTVGVNNSIFDVELNSLLAPYKSFVKEIDTHEAEINKLIEEVHPHYMSVPGIEPILYLPPLSTLNTWIYQISLHQLRCLSLQVLNRE